MSEFENKKLKQLSNELTHTNNVPTVVKERNLISNLKLFCKLTKKQILISFGREVSSVHEVQFETYNNLTRNKGLLIRDNGSFVSLLVNWKKQWMVQVP